MPIYEYQCSKCGHHLEALQKMADPPLRKCPDCGRQALTRLVSAVRFRLTGSGWYETDFKSDQETKRNLADRGEEAPGEKAKPDEAGAAKADAAASKAAPAAESATKPAATRKASSAGKAPARKAAPRKVAPRKAAPRKATAAGRGRR